MSNNGRKEVIKVMTASLLGDGCIHREKGVKNGRFFISQMPDHKDHVEYIATFMEEITRVRRYEEPAKENILVAGKMSRSSGRYSAISMNHPFYTKIHNRWYGTGRKSIDPHYLKLLDFEALAIWYMQDGSLGVRNGTILRVPLFMTDGFTLAEVMMLSQAVYERTGVITTLRKERKPTGEYYFRLRVGAKSTSAFIAGITPFVQPSFEYKLHITD
jgi:hypothetical protein